MLKTHTKNTYFCTIYVHVYEIVLRFMTRANEVVRASSVWEFIRVQESIIMLR